MSELASSVASAVASGTLSGAAVAWYTARKKVPAERDSIIVGSAETTVQAALAVASAEAARADRAESDNRDLRSRLDSALARVDQLQSALDMVRDELNSIKQSATH